jgi:uncharacterized Ntn-hydrolase superfamily protein
VLVSFTGTGAATFVDLPTASDRGIAVAQKLIAIGNYVPFPN